MQTSYYEYLVEFVAVGIGTAWIHISHFPYRICIYIIMKSKITFHSYFHGDAADGVDSPLDYIHIRMLRFSLHCVGLWPNWKDGVTWKKRIYVRFLQLSYIYALYANYGYLGVHENADFMDIGFCYLTIFLTVMNVSKSFLLPFNEKYCALVKKFAIGNNLFYYRNESEYAAKIHDQVHLISHRLTIFFISLTSVGPIAFNLYPMYDNYGRGMYSSNPPVNGTYSGSLNFKYDFMDWERDFSAYIIVSLFNWGFSYLCVITIIYTDLLVSTMVFQIWGHFKLLLNKMDSMPRPKSEINCLNCKRLGYQEAHYYTKEETRDILKRFSEMIAYHKMIVNCIHEVSDVYGFPMLVFYAVHQITGTLLLLELSALTTEAFLRFGLLTIVEFLLLVQVSVVFEIIHTVSSQLKDHLYSTPWECMDSNCKKIVFIFYMNVQEPVFLKALGLAQVGVQSMATILKTTFSYFAFLRTMN